MKRQYENECGIYQDMPSDTVFTDMASGKIDAAGFDLAKAKEMFAIATGSSV